MLPRKNRMLFPYDRLEPARSLSELLLDFLKVIINAIFCLAPAIDC